MGLIRLTKANKRRDRLLVASDAICAVEECSEQRNTRVMTMDGFWYEVIDDIAKVEEAINEAESRKADGFGGYMYTTTREETPQKPSRRAFMKRHKVLPPAVDKPQGRASDAVSGDSEGR